MSGLWYCNAICLESWSIMLNHDWLHSQWQSPELCSSVHVINVVCDSVTEIHLPPLLYQYICNHSGSCSSVGNTPMHHTGIESDFQCLRIKVPNPQQTPCSPKEKYKYNSLLLDLIKTISFITHVITSVKYFTCVRDDSLAGSLQVTGHMWMKKHRCHCKVFFPRLGYFCSKFSRPLVHFSNSTALTKSQVNIADWFKHLPTSLLTLYFRFSA